MIATYRLGSLNDFNVFSIPRTSLQSKLGQVGDDSRTAEELGRMNQDSSDSFIVIDRFNKIGFNYRLDGEGERHKSTFGAGFNELDRGFRVERNGNLITVNQRLLQVAPNTLSQYSATVPLNIPLGETISRMRAGGKEWKGILNDLGVKAEG